MDKSIPQSAAVILDLIRKTEVGTADRAGYDVIYGHKQGKLPKPLTSMTLDEIQEAQRNWSRHHGSSAAGAYQFMRATLKGLMAELGLKGSQRLDPDLQDRLAYHLLKRRGYQSFISGKMTLVEFGNRLAMEWASFPVLVTVQGQKRRVHRSESYYAGDGKNKALIKPEDVEAVLRRALDLSKPKPAEQPKPTPAPELGGDPRPASGVKSRLIFTGVAAALTGLAIWLSEKICGLTGFLCGG